MTYELIEKIKSVLPKLEGWCSPEKAEKLAEYITTKYFQMNGCYPQMVVELGVFGGKSLIPMAMALRENFEKHGVRGVIDGIDMWCVDAAKEGYIGKANAEYWEKMDFDYVYKLMDRIIKEEQLDAYINLFKGKSYELGHLFEGKVIDILHQDSSHSQETSLKELDIFLPKMKDGSIWIMDDVDWVDDNSQYTLHSAYQKLTNLGFIEIDDLPATNLQSHCKILRR